MRVGICQTKNTPHGRALIEALEAGVKACGDNAVMVRKEAELPKLGRCQATMQICLYSRYFAKAFNDRFRQTVEKTSKFPIILDTGFMQNSSETADPFDGYMSMGLGGIKGKAQYFNVNSPPDRWYLLPETCKNWRTEGEHILILGQADYGSSTQHLESYIGWLTKAIKYMLKVTDRPLVFRPHPNQLRLPAVFSSPKYRVSRDRTLVEDLRNAWCCYARTTNASVRAVLEGIPMVTEDDCNVTYPIASHDPKDVNAPVTPDRLQWLADLSYAQWNMTEIAAGLPWKHLRPHVPV